MAEVSGAESVRLAAAAVLDQGAGFIAGLSDECYTTRSEAIGASLGQHMRHALDHFSALMDGYESDAGGPVHYDQRQRGTDIETSRQAALERIEAIKVQLGALDEVQLEWPVRIRVMASEDRDEVELESNLVRELAFVTHHAIHHWAICRIATRELGVSCEAAFGRAPSTLAHDRS